MAKIKSETITITVSTMVRDGDSDTGPVAGDEDLLFIEEALNELNTNTSVSNRLFEIEYGPRMKKDEPSSNDE